MTTEEKTYKVTVHLIDGTKLKCSQPVTTSELMDMYRVIGRTDGGRVKFPTRTNTMQLLPVSSILRVAAVGEFE